LSKFSRLNNSVAFGSMLLTNNFLATLADKWGRKPIIFVFLTGLTLNMSTWCAILASDTGFFRTHWRFFVPLASGLNGALGGFGLVFFCIFALVADFTRYQPQHRATVFALLQGCSAVAGILGAQLSGLLMSAGPGAAFMCCLLLTLALAAIIAALLTDTTPPEVRARKVDWWRANALGALDFLIPTRHTRRLHSEDERHSYEELCEAVLRSHTASAGIDADTEAGTGAAAGASAGTVAGDVTVDTGLAHEAGPGAAAALRAFRRHARTQAHGGAGAAEDGADGSDGDGDDDDNDDGDGDENGRGDVAGRGLPLLLSGQGFGNRSSDTGAHVQGQTHSRSSNLSQSPELSESLLGPGGSRTHTRMQPLLQDARLPAGSVATACGVASAKRRLLSAGLPLPPRPPARGNALSVLMAVTIVIRIAVMGYDASVIPYLKQAFSVSDTAVANIFTAEAAVRSLGALVLVPLTHRCVRTRRGELRAMQGFYVVIGAVMAAFHFCGSVWEITVLMALSGFFVPVPAGYIFALMSTEVGVLLQGKVLAAIAAIEIATGLLGIVAFSSLFAATNDSHPSLVLVVAGLMIAGAALMPLCMSDSDERFNSRRRAHAHRHAHRHALEDADAGERRGGADAGAGDAADAEGEYAGVGARVVQQRPRSPVVVNCASIN
jgi:MFS family permease